MKKGNLYIIFTFLLALLFSSSTSLSAQVVGKHSFATESKMSKGKWVKIRIGQTAIYKITYSELRSMGFSDPSKVKVYGYGGAQLPESFLLPKRDDLPQVAVYRSEGNFILFYGQGVTSWSYNPKNMHFVHNINTYSLHAYYFLSDTDEAPLSPEVRPSSTKPTELTIKEYDDYFLHKKEEINIGNSGRSFFGESFQNQTSYTFSFSIPGIVSKTAMISTNFIGNKGGVLSIEVNEESVGQGTLPYNAGDNGYIHAKELTLDRAYLPKATPIQNVRLNYSLSGDKMARLNYLRLSVQRELRQYDSYTFFRSKRAIDTVARYEIAAPKNMLVWDLSDITRPIEIQTSFSGQFVQFTADSKPLTDYAVIDVDGSFPKVEFAGNVVNQNLHGLPQTDFVIIAHPDFVSDANTLAEEHRKRDGLRVTIVTPDQIYNEFSSGTPDATAYRWFLKMFYDRAMQLSVEQQNDQKPKYLLLYGDGTFDNRLISSQWRNSETSAKILTYQSPKSLAETDTYVTDDYFGLLDDNEGISLKNEKIDLGIGRFTVKNRFESASVLRKNIAYMENSSKGNWKNSLAVLGDDGDGDQHMRYANDIANYVEQNHKEFVVKKIYLDAFRKVISGAGESYPDAKKKLFDVLNSGVLMLNYVGHGSTNGWAAEQILTKADIQNLYLSKVPFWVTATCDFSRFDDFVNSGGEEAFLNENGGAIALITTVRVVYGNLNQKLNMELIRKVFAKNSDGTRYTLGDIIRETKRALSSTEAHDNNLNFILIGNPAMKLSYPEYKIKATSINDRPLSESIPDTLKAFSSVTIKGLVYKPDGTIATDFNGIITPTVYDSEEQVSCLGNNGSTIYKYNDRTKILFVGKDSVRNGEFSFTFVVPKNNSYSLQKGLINFYASCSEGNEAQGYTQDFVLGGTLQGAIDDETGPQIKKLYLNSDDFSDGSIVNETPLLVAELFDESGINVSSAGIGQDLQVVIDGKYDMSFSLNDFYESNPGDFRSGIIRFKFPKLNDGMHSLVFKAYDVHNNSSVQTLNFEVKSGHTPQLFDLYSSSNPIKRSSNKASFFLVHDRPGTNVTVAISVYDLKGVLLWKFQQSGLSESVTSFPVNWDLKDRTGKTVLPGVYLYKATISTDGVNEATAAKKMIIVND